MQIAGRIITGLVVLFLVFDALMKLIKEAHVVQAFAELGYPIDLAVVIGTILLTRVAVDCQLRAGKPLFETLVPFLFGMLVWAGLYLRDERLRAFLPGRK